MAPRTIYANLADGLQPFTLWDASLADMGSLGIIPCTATGTNTIVLTPVATAFAPSPVYANRNQFSFAAAATSSGVITLNIFGLGALPLYRVNGTTQATTGDLIINVTYLVAYNAALNAGNGGFQIISPGSISTSGALLPANNLSDVANAATSFDNISPTTTRGDLIARGAASNARLALGTSGFHLQSNGTDPVWAGFLQSGAGATTRTWNAKATDWVSVKDFGATGDNSTDDTAAIQAAITAVSIAGGSIYFPAGNYKISSALTISSTAVSLIGASRLSTVIRTTSATANIFTITATFSRIDSLALVGTSGTVCTAGIAISATNAHSGTFVNLYISDVFSGINLSNSTNALVQSVKMANIYGSFGVQTVNGGGDYIIDNQLDPVFYGAYTMTSGFGAWATGTVYALNAVRSANGGFFVCSQAGTSAGGGGGPVITGFGVPIVDNTVRWLFICSTTSVGVNIAATSNSNFVAYNDISGPWAIGIQVANSDGNILQVNTIGQILGSSIQIGTSGTNTLVHGNLVSGAYGQFAIGLGDVSTNTATGTRFLNNIVNGTGWMGINVQSSNSMANDNWVIGAGQITGAYGIEVAANINGFTVSDNTVPVSTSTGPIRVNAGTSDNYSVIGNQVGTGVIVDGGTGLNKDVVIGKTFSGLVSYANPIGYATGAGGAITQIISRTTGVILNKASGAITLFAAAPVVGTWVSFTVTNSAVVATDTIDISVKSGTNTYVSNVSSVGAGSFQISFMSIVGTASDSPVINFNVIKGVIS